ncbi:MAG: IgGFc-binding protein [Polyangiaceae bacterium]
MRGRERGGTVRGTRAWGAAAVLVGVAVGAMTSCFDRGDRYVESDEPIVPACVTGEMRCTSAVERCEGTGAGAHWSVVEDCGAAGKVCAPTLMACTNCLPSSLSCAGQDVVACSEDGSTSTVEGTCDPSIAEACRDGACRNLCVIAREEKSNVGCDYWGVDLDNAMINATSNASAQQFAIVVSNPQPDVPIRVHVYQDDSLPGETNAPYEIASATIAPRNLEVFKLGPREIDGSGPGEFNTGTHTALTRHAYRVTSDFPAVAYQFNPLDNVNVFSNDASLLYPSEGYANDGSAVALNYVVLGWPQTIAATDDPNTNFDPLHPINLRATLTIVGTREGTHVSVIPSTRVVGGGPVAETPKGGQIDATLGAFDVLNLETGDFNADFTGTRVLADGPVAVFSGSEASDAPHFATLADRRCCADHLEDQVAPIRTAGTSFAVSHTPSRTAAVSAAGAAVPSVPEPDYDRFIATREGVTEVTTTLPKPDDHFTLNGIGDFHEVRAFTHFTATSSAPVLVAQVMASQEAAGIKRGLPGGDPSLMMVPSLEQARADYVFLTPDKYAFDFITVVAPTAALVLLDGHALDATLCRVEPADGLTTEQRGGDPALVVYSCQLSFPTINPATDPATIMPGTQNDGVHHIAANAPVFVAVSGFDAFVSYAYAAGTDLREIAPPQ